MQRMVPHWPQRATQTPVVVMSAWSPTRAVSIIRSAVTMSFRTLSQSYSRLASSPLLFLDSLDQLEPQIESLINELRQLDFTAGTKGADLVDVAVQIISKLKTTKSLSLCIDSDAPPDASNRLSNPRAAVEDRFFKLAELEDFLDEQDHQFEQQRNKQNDSDEEDGDDDVDLFANVSEDGNEAMFTDFFDEPNESGQPESTASDAESGDPDEDIDTEDFTPGPSARPQHDRDMVVASDSESDDGGERQRESGPKSSYQKRKEAEDEKIRKLEKDMLGNKNWQLSGEVAAGHRPANSLLEEHLQFDFLSRQAPLVTEDFSHRIEDIIRQRIKNEGWDDVVRKTKPTEQAFEFKRRITLEQEKSKVSLAQVYEKEFLKTAGEVAEEKEDPAHTKIKKMARVLYAKLDALSSFHFTPRLPEPELKILNNLPAVTVEEAIPAAVSESRLLAPEEVSRKEKGELMSMTEKTSTDRKRERRGKKRFQKAKNLFTQNRKNAPTDPVSKNKYVKLQREQAVENALKKLPAEKLADSKSIRSSKSFFAQLDDRVTQAKAGKANTVSKKKMSSKALKL